MYISANPGYVGTFNYVFNYFLRYMYGTVRFRHKNPTYIVILAVVMKTSCFGLKCWFSSPQSQLEMSKLPVKHTSFYRHKLGCIFFRDLVKYTCFFLVFFPIKTAGDVPTSCQNHPVVGSCLYPAVSHLQKLKPQTRSLTYLLSYSYKLT